MPKRLVAIGGMVVLLTLAHSAAGQSVRFLNPESFRAQAGDPIKLRLGIADAAALQAVAWPGDERIRWFFVRGEGTQENRDGVQPDGGSDFVSVATERAGGVVVGLDLKPIVEEWEPAAFAAFAKRSSGATDQTAADRTPAAHARVRVERVESMKALVRVGESGQSQAAQSKTGQRVELRLMVDPGAASIGSDVPVRAYVRGDKRPGAHVIATPLGGGAAQELVTDATGSTNIRITAAGAWRVEFHHLEPAKAIDADWRLYSATATFEVDAAGAGR